MWQEELYRPYKRKYAGLSSGQTQPIPSAPTGRELSPGGYRVGRHQGDPVKACKGPGTAAGIKM